MQDHSAMGQKIASVAASACLASPSRLNFPNLRSYDMCVDTERHKEKTIYEGTYSSVTSGSKRVTTQVKVTCSVVTKGGTGAVSREVAGTSPEVNEMLSQVLKAGALGSQQCEDLQDHLENLLAFAKEAVKTMADQRQAVA
jgi:hypothetical protein